jgi:two-component system, cell cycle response regulator
MLHAVESDMAAPGAGTCVLIADDDQDILGLLRFLLEKEGYEVLQALDGLEALRLAHDREPDLCVLDISMPGADGYAVCRELQARGQSPPPVIFLTARAHPAARVSGLDAGAVDYVVKPFNGDELMARIRAALRTKTTRDALVVEATTDQLTGLHNRSHLELVADELVAIAVRGQRPISCLMIDLDHFKSVNDTYGHGAGDAVLKEAARRFATAVRRSDVLVRYGGEEFVALLPDTDSAGALVLAARLRMNLEAAPIMFEQAANAPVPIVARASVGVASLAPGVDGAAELISLADRAMYRAKALGRGRVELAAA